jgi:hypothetical protein
MIEPIVQQWARMTETAFPTNGGADPRTPAFARLKNPTNPNQTEVNRTNPNQRKNNYWFVCGYLQLSAPICSYLHLTKNSNGCRLRSFSIFHRAPDVPVPSSIKQRTTTNLDRGVTALDLSNQVTPSHTQSRLVTVTFFAFFGGCYSLTFAPCSK